VSFISLSEYISKFTQTFATGLEAQTWLNNNGYWTSYDAPYTFEFLEVVGAGSWTKPEGVTQVIVECWAGGGGGGGTTATVSGGGGGGGGQYARKSFTYASGSTSISYVIGAGGTSSTGNGVNGGNTTWNTNQVIAIGGEGGETGINNASTVGGLGNLPGSVGDVIYFGGEGGIGFGNSNFGTFSNGGGGGGGAGNSQDGNVGSGFIGGQGGFDYGGNGADGPEAIDSGGFDGLAAPSLNYGGGGSGGTKIGGANRVGGNGRQGAIRLAYR
jgi:hypothetical protein